jgi:putative serine protease PepD
MTDVRPPADEPPTPPGPTRHATVWAVAAGVVAIVVVAGLILVARDRSSPSTGATRRTAASTTNVAMCAATPVADDVLPSIVTIFARGARTGGGSGSGEIIQSGGYILTNNHVIAVAADGGDLSVLYSDGRSSDATIVGRDPSTDVAVIKAADQASGLPVIATTSSQALQVGQPVVALGAPLGLSSTVTSGIVSALNRYVPVPGDNGETAHLVDAIQTDASINPGNSGGALVDCAGRMVGMNSAIATVPNAQGVSGGGSVGLGFAIPIDLAKPLAEQIISTGSVVHPSTGLEVQAIPPAAAAKGGVSPGLYVTAVAPGSPAAKAGIRTGDVVTSIAGGQAVSAEQLTVATIGKQPGDTVDITYERDGKSTSTTLTLT